MKPGLLSVSKVTDQVYVGSTPKDLTDVEHLNKECGVNSIVSLQSDMDLIERQIDIDELMSYYQERDMSFSRFAINDGDPQDTARKLREPILYLVEQVKQGKVAYVHCNAGICRATSTVLGYLHLQEGMGLEEGVNFIRRTRPIANPYVEAVREALDGL